jgi:hypothetical protein
MRLVVSVYWQSFEAAPEQLPQDAGFIRPDAQHPH